MSGIETKSAGDDSGAGAKLKHIGTSLAPLALFVAGMLGWEEFDARRHANAVPAGLSAQPQQRPSKTVTAAVETPKPALAKAPDVRKSSAQAAAPGGRAIDPGALLDERSLLELSRLENARTATGSIAPVASAPAVAVPRAAPATPLRSPAASAIEQLVAARSLETSLSASEPLALDLVPPVDVPAGAYAILRGVPQNARLSHGIAVSDESWLIDGIDIVRTAIDLRAREAGKVVLELAVLSPTSQILKRESITIDVSPARPIQKPIAPAVVVSPAPQETVPLPVAPAKPPLTLRISPDTALVPGRGGLLKLEIEPAASVPSGAYVVVRGLPTDTVMSSGVPMGADAWLIALAAVPNLEIRLPAKASGTLKLDVKLVTSEGRFIAEDRLDIVLRAPVTAPPTASPVAAPAPAPAAATLLARATPPEKPTPLAPAQPPLPAQIPTKVPAQLPVQAPSLLPVDIGLTRGRRMLDIGNIASARPQLERSALEGSGEAAALLAATFDPDWLQRAGVVGLDGSPERARRWYEEAMRLGVKDLARVTTLPTRR